MKKLFLIIAFFALSYSVKAQTTITVYGRPTVTIGRHETTIVCDNFVQSACMTITTPTPVIIGNYADVTAYREDGNPYYTKSGVVQNLVIKNGTNNVEYTFTFEE